MSRNIEEIKYQLSRPQRVQNLSVLYATCREALAYIEQLEAAAQNDKPKRGRPAKEVIAPPAD